MRARLHDYLVYSLSITSVLIIGGLIACRPSIGRALAQSAASGPEAVVRKADSLVKKALTLEEKGRKLEEANRWEDACNAFTDASNVHRDAAIAFSDTLRAYRQAGQAEQVEKARKLERAEFDASRQAFARSETDHRKEMAAIENGTAVPGASTDTAPAPAPAAPSVSHPAPVAAPQPPAPVHTAALSPLAPRPGWIQGRLVNSAGQPVPNVTVYISGITHGVNAMATGSSVSFTDDTLLTVHSNGSGRFAQQLAPGYYVARAETTLNYNGLQYNWALDPVGYHTTSRLGAHRDSRSGIVQDFVLKISGPRSNAAAPGLPASTANPYGGTVQVGDWHMTRLNGTPWTAGSALMMRLTPQGPLLDGTQGRTLTYRHRFDHDIPSMPYIYLPDVPVGRYILTASLVSPNGEARPVKIRAQPDYDVVHDAAQIDFPPSAPTLQSVRSVPVKVDPGE